MSRITFVLFLSDGSCALLRGSDGRLALVAGEMADGEDEIDAVRRIPLAAAGFRTRRFQPFRWEGSRLYAWVEGDPCGNGEALEVLPPEDAGARLRAQGSRHEASIVGAAARSYRTAVGERAGR